MVIFVYVTEMKYNTHSFPEITNLNDYNILPLTVVLKSDPWKHHHNNPYIPIFILDWIFDGRFAVEYIGITTMYTSFVLYT